MDDRLNKYNNRTKKFNTDDIKIDIKFDISQLDLLCAYVVSNDPLIKRSNLNNLATIIKVINLDNYKGDKGLLDRLDYISKGLDAKLNKNLVNSDMVIMDINGGLGGHSNIQTRELNRDEIVWVNNAISEIIKHISIYEEIDKASELITEFKSTDFINRAPVVKKIEEWTTRLQNKFRKAKADISDEMMFSLIGDRYVDTIHDTFNQIKSPSNKLVFGTQALNIITGGGVFCEKVYVILGLPGEGKSSTLLDMALEIKKYNKDYKCKIPGKRPCVVLLIMENSIKETIERMFSMVTCGSNMDAYSSYEQIPQELEKHGLKISDDDPIDLIIKFKPNLSVDTGYLYELVEDLEDEGYEVICLIQDYLKRIRSVEGSFGGDLRLQLGAVVNEFKTFATIKNIPVITASQLNRTATSSIDNARVRNKSDLVRLIGRANVGESNLILENADWICLIAPEVYQVTGSRYLGMVRVKSRYYIPNKEQTVFIPYINNTIKFVEDFGMAPVHRISMKDEMKLDDGFSTNTNITGRLNGVVSSDSDVIAVIDEDDNLFSDVMISQTAAYNINNLRLLYNIIDNTPKKKLMYEVVRDIKDI